MPTISKLENQLENTTDQKTRIDLLYEIAWDVHLGDRERARTLAEQAYNLSSNGEFENEPYLPGLAGSLRTLAYLDNDAGNYDLALSQALHALEILENLPGEKTEISIIKIDVLGAISWTYRCLGDYVVAAEFAMKGLKLSQITRDQQYDTGVLNILSVIYAESNNLTAALETGQQVVKSCHERGLVRGESIALNNLAMTYLELGDGEQALETCKESLRVAHENELKRVVITALTTLGEIYLEIKDFIKAEESLLQALSLARNDKAVSDELQCLLNLGKVYQFQQKDDDALSAFQNALSLSQISNDRRGEYQCHKLLSEVFEKQQDFKISLQHFKQFHALKEMILNEDTTKRLAGLRVAHQIESAQRDAEIHYLKTVELKQEIEERKSAQESLQKLASIDPLTEMLNRRELFILGKREVEYATQKKQPLTAIIFDIDHLKKINDIYGHAIGDQALIRTAKIVQESLRQGEIVGRYGGDEFVILLPGSNCTQGQQIAERLYKMISSQAITTRKGNLFVTVSLGIAELNQVKDSTLETLLALADQALYAAKQAGRNQLVVYSDALL